MFLLRRAYECGMRASPQSHNTPAHRQIARKRAADRRPWCGPRFDLVALASSLGGFNALVQTLRELPPSFPFPVVVVQHLSPRCDSSLPLLLERRTRLRATWAGAGSRLEPGTITCAPGDRHLKLDDAGRVQLSLEARENFVRPSASVTFRSLVGFYGNRILAVVLSGMGKDGASGVHAIRRAGGRVLAQSRDSAECYEMPAAAIATGCVDHVLPAESLGKAIVAFTMVAGTERLFQVPLPYWAVGEGLASRS